jgi:hypothetical protein
MKFAYVGGDEETTAFGLRFPRGVGVEVTDAHAIRKLSNNPHFSTVVDGVEVMEPKRRGRPPKAK